MSWFLGIAVRACCISNLLGCIFSQSYFLWYLRCVLVVQCFAITKPSVLLSSVGYLGNISYEFCGIFLPVSAGYCWRFIGYFLGFFWGGGLICSLGVSVGLFVCSSISLRLLFHCIICIVILWLMAHVLSPGTCRWYLCCFLFARNWSEGCTNKRYAICNIGDFSWTKQAIIAKVVCCHPHLHRFVLFSVKRIWCTLRCLRAKFDYNLWSIGFRTSFLAKLIIGASCFLYLLKEASNVYKKNHITTF